MHLRGGGGHAAHPLCPKAPLSQRAPGDPDGTFNAHLGSRGLSVSLAGWSLPFGAQRIPLRWDSPPLPLPRDSIPFAPRKGPPGPHTRFPRSNKVNPNFTFRSLFRVFFSSKCYQFFYRDFPPRNGNIFTAFFLMGRVSHNNFFTGEWLVVPGPPPLSPTSSPAPGGSFTDLVLVAGPPPPLMRLNAAQGGFKSNRELSGVCTGVRFRACFFLHGPNLLLLQPCES